MNELDPFPQRPSRTTLLAATAAAVAAAVVTQVLARKAERDHPPIGRMIDVDGVRLHYVDRGEGPPVVLIHGNAVRLEDFIASGLVDRLAATHRVIAFDRPGFGYSTRPRRRVWTVAAQAALLQRALRRLDVERPVVVGHSFGALVALAMALDHPIDVKSLVLLGGYYYPTARVDVALATPTAIPVVGDVLRYTLMPLAARLGLPAAVRAMFAPRPVPVDFLDVVSRALMVRPKQLRANAEDAAAMIPAAARMRSRYGALTMPVSIIAGEQDRIVDPVAHSERLHRELTRSTLLIVPGAGHMVHHVAGDRLANEVDRIAVTELALNASSPEGAGLP